MKIIVSIAIIKHRLSTLPILLESIKNQTVTPHKVYLCYSNESYLLDEGISDDEILPFQTGSILPLKTKNTGSYRKLLPVLQMYKDDDVLIITLDDDIYYPVNAIETLVDYYNREKCIIAFRGNKMKFNKQGRILPYTKWETIKKTSRSIFNFPTGVFGILYHPSFFIKKVFDISTALKLCPTSDDVWFKFMTSVSVCIVINDLKFPVITEKHQVNSLYQKFNKKDNDKQIKKLIAFLSVI